MTKRAALEVGLSILFAAFLLNGCASVVYKDSASTYVASGRAITKAIGDTSASLAAAEDRVKREQIISDQKCPIAEERLFVRDGAHDDAFARAVAAFPARKAEARCQSLIGCESHPDGSDCAGACYSDDQGQCITEIETDVAIELKKPVPDPVRAALADPVAKRIQKLEYGGGATVQNQLIVESVKTITRYLDILQDVVESRTNNIQEKTKKLSTYVTSASDELENVTGHELSSNQKATRDHVMTAVTAFGKLASDFEKMARDAKDAAAIRAYVRNNPDNVPQLISAIRPVVQSDALLGETYSDIAMVKARASLQSAYGSTADAYQRRLLFADRDRYQFADANKLQADLDAAFNELLKSHESLVSLVENPTDEQQKKLLSASYESFKTIAADIQDAASDVKAFP